MGFTEMKVTALRGGEEYKSLDKEVLTNYSGEEIGEISQLSPMVLYTGEMDKLEEEGFRKLQEMPTKEVLEKIRTSADYFSSEVDGRDFEEYCENVSQLTGLPISDVRKAGKMMAGGLKEVEQTVKAQLPNENLDLLDGYEEGNNFVLSPKGKSLGVVPPSNHPAVNTVWVNGTAMKFPTAIRPANEEPLTSRRVIRSLQETGLPDEALSYLPGDRQFADELLNESDLGIIFGSDRVISKYEDNGRIETFGPGNSKLYIDEDYVDEDIALDIAKEAMMADGGRGCINISQIVTEENGRKFAERLAEEVNDYDLKDPLDEEAVIPAMNKEDAERLNSYIEEAIKGAEDLTYPNELDRYAVKDGAGFIRPTVVYINDNPDEHELFTEFPFQYSSVTDYEEGILKDTLTLTMLTDDTDKVEEALSDPSIEKVYVGVPSNDIDLKQPHEGYLADFLFKKKAYKMDSEFSEDESGFWERFKSVLTI